MLFCLPHYLMITLAIRTDKLSVVPDLENPQIQTVNATTCEPTSPT